MDSKVPRKLRVSAASSMRRHRAARRIAADAVVSGTAASLASAAALMVASASSEGSVAGGLNGPSQWLWGEDEAYTRRWTLRHTATGYVIHNATSIFWAALYETVFGGKRRRSPFRRCAEAAVSAGTAYVVDYYLTPPRFRPGFEKHVSRRGMVGVYAAFAAGLAITAIARDLRR